MDSSRERFVLTSAITGPGAPAARRADVPTGRGGPGCPVTIVTFLNDRDDFAAGAPAFISGLLVGPLPAARSQRRIPVAVGAASGRPAPGLVRWVNAEDVIDITPAPVWRRTWAR